MKTSKYTLTKWQSRNICHWSSQLSFSILFPMILSFSSLSFNHSCLTFLMGRKKLNVSIWTHIFNWCNFLLKNHWWFMSLYSNVLMLYDYSEFSQIWPLSNLISNDITSLSSTHSYAPCRLSYFGAFAPAAPWLFSFFLYPTIGVCTHFKVLKSSQLFPTHNFLTWLTPINLDYISIAFASVCFVIYMPLSLNRL